MKRMIALIPIFLIILLTSCSLINKKIYIDKPIPIFPPEELLKECNKSEFNGKTYKELISYVLKLKEELDNCNSDKKLINDWKEKLIKSYEERIK